ncbi:hypothetical protein D3C73_812690 [compost metagenome]
MVLRCAASHLTALGRAQARVARLGISAKSETSPNRHLTAAVLGGVLDVFGDQRARGQLVQAIGHRLVAAGDDAAYQLGVVLDINLVAAVTRPQTRLFRDGLEVAVHLAGAGVG